MKEQIDTLDKPIDGEFVWYDEDKRLIYYQNGTQILGSIDALMLEQKQADIAGIKGVSDSYKERVKRREFLDSIKSDWLRLCRHKYYIGRYGRNYRKLFENPTEYWEEQFKNSIPDF